MVRHKGGMRQGRAGSDDLGTADVDTTVSLTRGVHAHLGAFVNGAIPVHWGMNDGMVKEKYLLLRLLVPCHGIGLVRRIKRGIGPQGTEKSAFVIWGTPQPAVGQACPGSNRITRRKLLFPGV